jgi:hypothetical protein
MVQEKTHPTHEKRISEKPRFRSGLSASPELWENSRWRAHREEWWERQSTSTHSDKSFELAVYSGTVSDEIWCKQQRSTYSLSIHIRLDFIYGKMERVRTFLWNHNFGSLHRGFWNRRQPRCKIPRSISGAPRFTKPLIFTISKTTVITDCTSVFKIANNRHIKNNGFFSKTISVGRPHK